MDLQNLDLVSERPLGFQPKGISPWNLLQQVRNTVPYLFQGEWGSKQRFISVLQNAMEIHSATENHPVYDPVQYFEICLSAHWATVASFVPTDVDNQIRFKLWHPSNSTETILKMSEMVRESLSWDYRSLSARWISAPESGELLSGHHGEWFSVAVAAYGALRRRAKNSARDLLQTIHEEIAREVNIFKEFEHSKDGIGALKACTILAHNLGDFQRVIDMWGMDEEDPIQQILPLFHSTLNVSGSLNQSYMANENHRHFALRAARCLRRDPALLLPIGPFLDDWGHLIATYPGFQLEDIGEVTEALVDGWARLGNCTGYARALAGIESGIKGGLQQLCRLVPARIERQLCTGALRTATSIPKPRFEAQWQAKGSAKR